MHEMSIFLQPGFKRIGTDGSFENQKISEIQNLSAELLVIDLEMSGPNPREHEVLDVGGILVKSETGFPEVSSWGSKVRPLHIGTGNLEALATVAYTSKKWRDSISLEEAFEKISKIGKDTIITGWGIKQDLLFLTETYRRLNEKWPFSEFAIDVQDIARKMVIRPEIDRYNLGHVADRLNIGRMPEHSALGDAYTTYDVLTTLWGRTTKANRVDR
tara:strand:+ start:1517 stop:2164 length:648 start_codon:yes stop_codon:yes gene_type:complete